MSAKEISALVRKITRARKIQRDRINSQQISIKEEEANITKLQQPVVEEVAKQAKNTILAIEHQQAQLAQINDNLVRNRQLRHTGLQHQQLTPTASSASTRSVMQPSFNEKWVQNFYKKNKLPVTRVTKLEADLSGNIGEHGFIDIPELFNEARLRMRLGETYYESKPEKVTKGLMALLLLPFDDMQEAKIQPTPEDQDIYRVIMEKAGCKSSRNNKKFKAFLKDLDDDSLEDLTWLQEISPQKEEDEERAKTHGKGVFPYSHPEELRDRLDILFGSIRAGNNSKEVRSETRSLLDEMLEKQCIFPHIHEKFCNKFHL